VGLEQLDKLIKYIDLIRILTSDLSACSILLHPYMLPLKGGDIKNAEMVAVSLVPILVFLNIK
jgi:hypothetical protein